MLRMSLGHVPYGVDGDKAMILQFDQLPPPELNPNANTHYRVRANVTRAAKLQCLRLIGLELGFSSLRLYELEALWRLPGVKMELPPHGVSAPPGARVVVTFTVPTKRRRDKGNLI